jgi:hypothetical protein
LSNKNNEDSNILRVRILDDQSDINISFHSDQSDNNSDEDDFCKLTCENSTTVDSIYIVSHKDENDDNNTQLSCYSKPKELVKNLLTEVTYFDISDFGDEEGDNKDNKDDEEDEEKNQSLKDTRHIHSFAPMASSVSERNVTNMCSKLINPKLSNSCPTSTLNVNKVLKKIVISYSKPIF